MNKDQILNVLKQCQERYGLNVLKQCQERYGLTGKGPVFVDDDHGDSEWMIEWDGFYLHPTTVITTTIAGDQDSPGFGIDVTTIIGGIYWEPEDWDVDEDVCVCHNSWEAIKQFVSMVIEHDMSNWLEYQAEKGVNDGCRSV